MNRNNKPSDKDRRRLQAQSKKPSSRLQSIQETRKILRERNLRAVSRNPKLEKPAKIFKTTESDIGLVNLLNSPEIAPPDFYEYASPKWFNTTTKADVSVIVPLYKSDKEVVDLINSWEWDSKYNVELIFVDDCCPNNSKEAVMRAWAQRSKRAVGKIIVNVENRGYGGACNVGAMNATGDYLIFLNADTLVTPNWIDPIIDRIKSDDRIGIVGNLQLKHGGMWHEYIDSAGSEWRWDALCFVHIGRHSYEHKNLEQPFKVSEAPKDVLAPGERDMVTGCCLAIRKKMFDEVGGYNLNYRVGYWEDSELCMTVKEMGYKIFFEPNSVIRHKLGHSNAGNHKFHTFNRAYFMNKWVNSNRIDGLVTSPRKSPNLVRGILIQRNAAHGDVLVAAGIVPALKKKYPGCQITFLTQCPKILLGHPHIDFLLDNPKKVSNRTIQLFYNLDMAYEFRPHTNILKAYADVVGVPYEDCEVACGHAPTKETLPTKYVVMHPGRTNWVGRDWNEEGFENIAQRLLQEGYRIVCIGRAGDRGVTCDLDLRGKTNIQEMATVIKKASFFIGVDSMPMHVAQSFKIPGVCFFGSITPETRLFTQNMIPVTVENLSCLGCHHRKPAPSTVTNFCETAKLECEKLLSAEKFWKKVKEGLCQV